MHRERSTTWASRSRARRLVADAQQRLAADGLATATEDAVECCFALQDKVWVDGPDAEPWEIYTVLADVESTPTCC